ncbi:MAG: CDP-diacylglycerol--glycerol-3-phosphate 3-phosphatidyltransferase, partial [Clostridia bacterium]|nr:CDP-diacylglycerol--glycerol-3-phosphate 3-phosphatidyltransferase [Clostridia bacterium]
YDFFGVLDSSPDSVNPINVAGLVLLVIAAVLTIWSGVSYIVKNREVLKESE